MVLRGLLHDHHAQGRGAQRPISEVGRMLPKSPVLMPTSLHCTPTLYLEALLSQWWLWAAYAQLQKSASEPPGFGRGGGHGEGLGGP